MLKITIPAMEAWDPVKEEFVQTEETKLVLEHSLLSVSKWESTWKIPFAGGNELTAEQSIDYVKCMCINPVKDDSVFYTIPRSILMEIKKYIDDPMSASKFDDKKKPRGKAVYPSEQIYCFMTMYGIPFETEKWHLNRLLALIRWCGIENAPKEKMSETEILMRNAKLNAERKARLHTRG